MTSRFLSEAELELAEIALRYESVEPGWAADFYRRLKTLCRVLLATRCCGASARADTAGLTVLFFPVMSRTFCVLKRLLLSPLHMDTDDPTISSTAFRQRCGSP